MKVAIAGYGVEGEASCQYWLDKGAEVTVFDEKMPSHPLPGGVDSVIGTDAFERLEGYDMVIRTASLRPDKIKTDGKVWSATNEFFAKCPAQIIGVTGTKGKGTASTLIAEILKAAGKTVHLVGNIGLPALEILEQVQGDDIVVFELSSFQLWDLEKSPEIAVVLMIEADHMDVHASMDEYVAAKANVTTHQKSEDLLIYHPTNRYAAEIATRSAAGKRKFFTPEGAYVNGQDIVIEGQVVCSTSDIGLIGAHNLENVCAAVTAAWRYTQDIRAIRSAVANFKGLPHRLEFVDEIKGVAYYNDSFSSAPGATVAAIRSFDQPIVLICGGFDRGLDYSELTAAITEQQNIKKVLLIGQTAAAIGRSFDTATFDKFEILTDMDMPQILQKAASESADGDIVLLSPGCASFDMFKDFKDRGEQFKAAVGELA
ncbi:MAG: UDP-N-acetylmuramoyl-L-alanine--D-glutamate ligase [Candidatus Saccharimonadales bacterium]